VRPAAKLFIVGGGNVGLIAGYHALQAGIGVVGLVEALPECGGYKVHKDKLVRLGVPIYPSHTILSANGSDKVESVSIAAVDERFITQPGTEQSFECDAVLIAVGLNPVNEFFQKAVEFGFTAFSAGDAEEIAEASAAMFSGRIKGLEIYQALGGAVGEIPSSWYHMGEILKSRPGEQQTENFSDVAAGIMPIIHCTQEIPCDPCSSLCTHHLIEKDPSDIRHLPDVTIPYEFGRETIRPTDRVIAMDTEGVELGVLAVTRVAAVAAFDHTLLVQVQAPRAYARHIAGIRVQEKQITHPMNHYVAHVSDDTIVCRCERVTAGEIRALVRQGYRDMNELKVVTRAGMGACGAKTCNQLIHRIFREEGVPSQEVADHTRRPLFIEVPLGVFAGETTAVGDPE
jgi:sarcosine oxidase subunit alpha